MLTTILGLLGKVLPSLGGAASSAGRWLWSNRKTVLPVLVPAVLLVGALAWTAWHYRAQAIQATHRAVQADERALLEERGFTVARQDLTRANSEVEELRRSLAAIKIPSRAIANVSGTTGPVTVGGAGLAGPSSPPSGAAPAPPIPNSSSGVGGCRLADGDQGEIRVSGGAVQTESGNVVVTGRADAYGLNPERHLFGGSLNLHVSIPSAPAAAPRPAWGLGAAFAVTPRGWSAGPVLAAPPFRFLGRSIEPQLAATFGKGEWTATGSIVVRGSR